MRIVPQEDPNSKAVTYEMGVIQEKADGSGNAIDENGKLVIDWSGAKQTYASKEAAGHLDYWSAQANPDFTSSERMAGLSSKRKLTELKAQGIQQEEFKIREEKRLQESKKYTEGVKLTKSQIKLNEAQAKAAGQPKSQIPIREFEAVNRKWDDVTRAEEADDINYFMSRENLKNRAALLKDYANGDITEEVVRNHMAKSGITSQKFIRDVLDNADDIAETKRDKEPSDFMKWWSN
jgi:hypothetical protein